MSHMKLSLSGRTDGCLETDRLNTCGSSNPCTSTPVDRQRPCVPNPFPGPSNSSTPRLLVFGDSMTRGLGDILQDLLPEYDVLCTTCPGAPLSFAIKDLQQYAGHLTKKDIVFILAGNNNVPQLTPVYLDEELSALSNLCLSTNLVISSIPFKYNNTKYNTNIFATNTSILHRCRVYQYYYFDCNFFLSRSMYTRHGLHFNKTGKNTFCKYLANAILSFDSAITPPGFLLPGCPNTDLCGDFLANITCPLFSDTILNLSSTVNSPSRTINL
ncbi:hypothetical protein WDU94_008914 [Cyamophila willieti]